VGRSQYWHAEESSRFFMERISYQVDTKKLLDPTKKKALSNYIQIVQREFNLDAVEVYDPNASRLMFALSPELEDMPFGVVSADNLLKEMPLKGVRSISEIMLSGELLC
jgi:two-component system nitrogen regulation sensor histidine kinase NtrY